MLRISQSATQSEPKNLYLTKKKIFCLTEKETVGKASSSDLKKSSEEEFLFPSAFPFLIMNTSVNSLYGFDCVYILAAGSFHVFFLVYFGTVLLLFFFGRYYLGDIISFWVGE